MSGWKKVSDYLPVDVANVCRSGMCKVGNKDVKLPTYDFETMQDIESVLVETYVIGYNELYAEAIGFYRSGNYKVAAQKYESMVAKYPDNALLRNDLSATYNMLGRYNDAIKQAKDVLHRIGDASQYAAAQYNAGVAYEALGNLQKALANYKLSLANGNKKVQKHISRVTEQMKKPENKRVAFMMSAERLRSNMNEMQEKQQPVPQQIYGGKLV